MLVYAVRFYYASKSAGIAYFFTIDPYGSNSNAESETSISLQFIDSMFKDINVIETEFEIYVRSAKFCKLCTRAETLFLCKSVDFFDPKNKYFVDDEIVIRASGIIKFDRALISKMPYFFSMKWIIKVADLEPLRTSNDGRLESNKCIHPSHPDIKYFLAIYRSGEKIITTFSLECEDDKKVVVIGDFLIKSHADKMYHPDLHAQNSGGFQRLCIVDDFFDLTKGYIIDGEFTINFEGCLYIEKTDPRFTLLVSGYNAATLSLEKNFKITVGQTELNVNKNVLASVSPRFSQMFHSETRESIENRIEITDFPFKIVDAALYLIHGISPAFTLEDMLPLLAFSDIYDFPIIENLVANHLITILSPANVCQLIHFSTIFEAPNLYKKSAEFLVYCYKNSIVVEDLDLLDKEMYYNIFSTSFPAGSR